VVEPYRGVGTDVAEPVRGALTSDPDPPSPSARRRPLLLLLALLLAAGNLLYAALWTYYVRHPSQARVGIDIDYAAEEGALVVNGVSPGSPAQRAGLRAGDHIVAVNGRRISGPYLDAAMRGAPGDVVRLTVERPPADTRAEISTTLVAAPPTTALSAARWLATELITLYALPFIGVGLAVLFSRLEDRNAWLLALLFTSFAVGGPFLMIEGQVHPLLRGPALAWKVLFNGLAGALFYYFFAVFPTPSPLDRRVPWLKNVLLGGSAAVAVPLALWALVAGGSAPLLRLVEATAPVSIAVVAGVSWSAVGLGVASLLSNARSGAPDVRRKTKVIVWGTVAGVMPSVLGTMVAAALGKQMYEMPFWFWAPSVLALFLLPAAFAYAVVVYRALDIPVLLKRSARYVLVKQGFAAFTLTGGLAATLLLAAVSTRVLSPRFPLAVPAGLLVGAAFGALLVSAGMRVERRVASRIDRAFFRGAYDVRQILQDLADQARAATDATSLAALLEAQLAEALHPRSMAIYLEAPDGSLLLERGDAPADLRVLPPVLPLLADLARRGQPWELPPGVSLGSLEALHPECLTPVLGRSGRLVGLIVLDERLSEETYSREDRRLLSSVAAQAGIAMESIRLAERMAERLEAERRASYEMDIAQEIQRRLFPQTSPAMATLEYAGGCKQARAVGGDYFDFLEREPGRLGLVLADVSGKGISAALLMASLQAILRSQHAAIRDPADLLRAVNRVFYPSAAPNRFATVFFAEYEDATRRLRYVNCGHNAPAVLRADARVDRLPATATVLGLFAELECTVAETVLGPGDVLLVFSDGASEAFSDSGEEYGEDRLIQVARGLNGEPVQAMVDAVAREVQAFSGREQEDDLTLLIARAR
jgi:phosphoserine phosphatase RsbU/P